LKWEGLCQTDLDELSNEIEDDGLDDDEGGEERTDPLDGESDELDEETELQHGWRAFCFHLMKRRKKMSKD